MRARSVKGRGAVVRTLILASLLIGLAAGLLLLGARRRRRDGLQKVPAAPVPPLPKAPAATPPKAPTALPTLIEPMTVEHTPTAPPPLRVRNNSRPGRYGPSVSRPATRSVPAR